MNQIVDPNITLRNFDEAHCRVLVKSFRSYNHGRARGMVKVYVSCTFITEGAKYTTDVHSINSMELRKDSCRVVLLDGCDKPCSVEMLRYKDGDEWVVEPLHMRYEFVADAKSFLPAQSVELNRTANNSTGIVHDKARLKTPCSLCWATREHFKKPITYAFSICMKTMSWKTWCCQFHWLQALQ